MRLPLVILSLCVSVSAFAEVFNLDGRLKGIEAAEAACVDVDTSNHGMMICLDAKLKASDDLLNQVYQDRMSTLKSQAAQEVGLASYEQYAQPTIDRLKTAQRAWITFRDAECSYKGTTMLHGSGESFETLSCLANMTFERVKAIAPLTM